MKIAVINFSGNVGKTTVARHLLQPRIPASEVIAVESINADADDPGQALRGKQFAELQEYMQTVENAIVDIGASNVEDLLGLMRRYQGSQDDFDFFVVPTVPAHKPQRDTMATLVELAGLGIPPARLKIVFNMVEDGTEFARVFDPLLSFLQLRPVAPVCTHCRLGANEIYGRAKTADAGLVALAQDATDYKALIAAAHSVEQKIELAQALATRRLARGVLPELDACFAALALDTVPA